MHEGILLINDGSFLLRMTDRLLAQQGYRIYLTDCPAKALEILDTQDIGLLMTKFNGADPDRVEVIKRTQALRPKPRSIVIGDSEGLPPEVYEIPADDYIIMPCRVPEFWLRLSPYLQGKRAPAPAREQVRSNPLNYKVLNKIVLLFLEMKRSLVSTATGLKMVHRQAHGTSVNENETLLENLYVQTIKSISLTDGFLNNFFEVNCSEVNQRYKKHYNAISESNSKDLADDPYELLSAINRCFELPLDPADCIKAE